MVRVNADEFADEWASQLSASTERIRRGVERTDKDPPRLAIAKKEKLRQRFLQALEDGTWDGELNKVTKADWQRSMVEKGVPRIPSGAEASKEKMRDFASKLLPYVSNLQKEIEKMPDLTLQDSINRATKWISEMAKFSYKGRR